MIAEATSTSLPSYAERERDRLAKNSREGRKDVADIGDLPPVKNPTRKALCKEDLHLFLQCYFPESTGLAPFGESHIVSIERIQRAIIDSGRILNCMPRGFGKSTISENAIIWAVLYGHRKYGLILAATGDAANQAIEGVMKELQENEVLFEDFPEVCYPIRELENKAQRCKSQTYKKKSTHIRWTADSIVMPRIPGSLASEAIIRTKVFASTRGARYKRADGKQARPDLVIIDDPQTDDSAVSPMQTSKLMTRLRSSIMRLGSHGKAMATIMNATVIADGDLVDQLADVRQHPEWQAIRAKMVPEMPERFEDLWLIEYANRRRLYDPDDLEDQRRAHADATDFYLANRQAMDAGARVSWPHIPLPAGEVSALQHAMNILIDDGEDAFASECQNEPRRAVPAGMPHIVMEEVKGRYNGLDRYVVPEKTSHVVFHCDVHDGILYWTTVAIQHDFTAAVVDYGTFPDQPQPHFSMYSLKRKLQEFLGTDSVEEAIALGVETVANSICGRSWITPDGQTFEVARGLFDVGYKPEEVALGIRNSRFANVLMGSRGVGIGPAEKPMTEYDTSPKKVRRAGPEIRRPRWYIPRASINGVQIIRFDANYWKSVLSARFMQHRSTSGEWSMWGNHRVDHSHFADHMTSEEPVPTTARGRTVVQWKLRPNRENHWFDTAVGCAVAASLEGCRIGTPAPTSAKSPKQSRKRREPRTIQRPDGRSFFVTAR